MGLFRKTARSRQVATEPLPDWDDTRWRAHLRANAIGTDHHTAIYQDMIDTDRKEAARHFKNEDDPRARSCAESALAHKRIVAALAALSPLSNALYQRSEPLAGYTSLVQIPEPARSGIVTIIFAAARLDLSYLTDTVTFLREQFGSVHIDLIQRSDGELFNLVNPSVRDALSPAPADRPDIDAELASAVKEYFGIAVPPPPPEQQQQQQQQKSAPHQQAQQQQLHTQSQQHAPQAATTANHNDPAPSLSSAAQQQQQQSATGGPLSSTAHAAQSAAANSVSARTTAGTTATTSAAATTGNTGGGGGGGGGGGSGLLFNSAPTATSSASSLSQQHMTSRSSGVAAILPGPTSPQLMTPPTSISAVPTSAAAAKSQQQQLQQARAGPLTRPTGSLQVDRPDAAHAQAGGMTAPTSPPLGGAPSSMSSAAPTPPYAGPAAPERALSGKRVRAAVDLGGGGGGGAGGGATGLVGAASVTKTAAAIGVAAGVGGSGGVGAGGVGPVIRKTLSRTGSQGGLKRGRLDDSDDALLARYRHIRAVIAV